MGKNLNTINLLNKRIAILVELGLFNWRFQEVAGSAWLPRCKKATHLLSASSPVVVFAVPWVHQPIGRRKCSDFTSLGCRLIRYMYTLLFVYVRTLLRQTSSLCIVSVLCGWCVLLLLLCKHSLRLFHTKQIYAQWYDSMCLIVWQIIFETQKSCLSHLKSYSPSFFSLRSTQLVATDCFCVQLNTGD